MKQKLPLIFYLVCFFVVIYFSYSNIAKSNICDASDDIIVTYGTIDSLKEGKFSGDFTYSEIKECGDFGIGTFNNIEGEMVADQGMFYQAKTTEPPNIVVDDTHTPFATVAYFNSDHEYEETQYLNFDNLTASVAKHLKTNALYAVRINGLFKQLTIRSVDNAGDYKSLSDVTENQTIVNLNDIYGTMVGFYYPPIESEKNNLFKSGFHFHFVSDDAKYAGHILDVLTEKVKIQFDRKNAVITKL